MEAEKIKLVVINNNTLGYVNPGAKFYGVLRSKVVSGNPHYDLQLYPLDGKNYRLASDLDFEAYRVHSEGFINNPNYLHA